MVLQKKELQGIFTEIPYSSNNPSEKVFSMAFGAIARILKNCKIKDKDDVEFVKIARVSAFLC